MRGSRENFSLGAKKEQFLIEKSIIKEIFAHLRRTMLVKFSVKNWMSFRDEVCFSMVASREKNHGVRVPRVSKYKTRILPVAGIYGGNASGKTNLIKALRFAKMLVVKGTQPKDSIPVEVFLLDEYSAQQPSRFTFELLVDETIYEYSFVVTRDAVLEEKLVLITATDEKMLYARRQVEFDFGSDGDKDGLLKLVSKATRDNQLFLTNSVFQNIENFRPVHDWFADNLQLVAPESRFTRPLLDGDHPKFASMNSLLTQLDTGISDLSVEEVPIENIPFPVDLIGNLSENMKEGQELFITAKGDPFSLLRRDGKVIATKLMTFHSSSAGDRVKFGMQLESDGSRRVIELLPAFLELTAEASRRVFVIDELDRSLHTLLSRHLLDEYLSSCSPTSRAQLVFTTHDVLLMDQKLLRRDEMWVAERDRSGGSSLISFNEYRDVRYDKDVRKSYLQGRLGGIPRINSAKDYLKVEPIVDTRLGY